MKCLTGLLGVLPALMLGAGSALGQEPAVQELLVARGAPAEFADRVAAIVASATADGLPTGPIAQKALEGWAKRGRVPPDRIISVLGGLTQRLRQGRDAATAAGLASPPGAVVAAAAEALGRGLTAEQVGEVIRAAPTPEAAATGITVAASLAAQGLETAAAVTAVSDAYADAQPPELLLELPSALAELMARGVPLPDVARQILEGGGLPLPSIPGMGAAAGRPAAVPPARGPVTDIPVPPVKRPPRP